MEKFVLLFILGCCIVGVNGQIGVTGCTAGTQANCPNFLPNSYCNLGTLLCECPAGYVASTTNTACEYECGALAAPDNGAVDTSAGTVAGSVATFSCVSMYKLSGSATSTCVDSTGWDNTATTCVPAELGDSCATNIFQCNNIVNGQCLAFSTCECQAGYEDDGTGYACTEIDECASNPCENGGTCVDALNSYSCNCVAGYMDTNCETDINECAGNPCQNGGTCTDGINSYTCACVAGFDGNDCENNINECSSNPCQNGGTCLDGTNAYLCSCVAGYMGTNCETNINECDPNLCQNGATCVDGINQYTCTCVAGYDGNNCENNIDECVGNACTNGATCVDGINQYTCNCVAGYDGEFCGNNIDECASHACQNSATCVDGINAYTCVCPSGYDGEFCNNNIDECAQDPCINGGTCIDEVNDYTCNCVTGYTDKTCATNIDDCAANPCQNGATCLDDVNDYSCVCVAGYTDKNCDTDIDECANHICQNGATCVDNIDEYTCLCAPGYEGTYCVDDIDECENHNCQNGAVCIDGIDGYTCDCVNGYDGTFCQNNINECASHSCLNGATCVDGIDGYTCSCVDGYTGEFCATDIDECISHACVNGATCVDAINLYTCDCVTGYTGTFCETNIDECDPDPCQNGATCVDNVNDYTCNCVDGYTDKNCQTNIDECDPDPCQNGATCVDNVNDYTCNCVAGYEGKNCGTNIDECDSDPCQNGGTCTDEVNQYTCTCVPGYNGDECENNIDECNGNLCENGATCVDGINLYTCDCVPGYDGTYCGNDIDECASHNCLNGATCNDEINTYSCICVTGYTDQYCQTDINECASTPCDNGGSCTDLVNGFECSCSNGFTGLTCRAGELGDGCSTRAEVCANLANAECDGSICVCVTGYEDPTGATGTCSRVDCGTITPPVDGSVDHGEGTLYESKAYFSCNAGYTLTGVSSATCQADATWDGTAPTCVIKNCGTLATPLNGNLQYTPNTEYLGLAEFSCNTGYTLVGDATRTCQDTGVWGGTNPTCQINDCGTIVAPTNGAVDLTDGTTYQSVIVFQCSNGYDLVGESSLECQADSNWDGSKPTCNIKDCGFLSDPTNGAVDHADGTTYLAEAGFSCDTGYTLMGVSSRICQASGSWSGTSDPYCQINDCGILNNPDNGNVDIQAGTTYGQTATYSCDAGFELNGVLQRNCQPDGTWSTAAPTCDRLDCGTLKAPTDGSVDLTAGTLFEATAVFTCDAGYTLTGDTERYCTNTGVWDNSSPTCIIKDCGTLTDPANGQVLTVFGTTYGQTAEYSCNSGYQVNGVSTRTCQADGTWSATDPTCVILDCGPVADIVNGGISYSDGTIYGSTVYYSCNNGYEVTGVASRVCLATGEWSDSQPVCTILDCDATTSVPNAVARTPSGSQVGDIAIYECNSGYGLVGNPNVTCEASGFWGTVPECRLDCGTPPAVANGAVLYPGGTLVSATATYTCDAGYYISGDTSIECQDTGSWTNEPFCFIILVDYNGECAVTAQCLTTSSSCRDDGAGADRCLCDLTGQHYDSSIDTCLADCGGLTSPTNGEIQLPAIYSAGQIAVYSCDRGYSLTGPGTRTCLDSGQWNGTAPQCTEGCPDPQPPEHGQVQTSNGLASGDTITYTCDDGYALVGAAERKCNSDSQWSGNEPTCNIQCPVLLDIGHGWVDLALGRWEGSKAVYVCENNYAVVGASTRTCQSSGLWDGVEPECVFAIFPDVLLVFGSLFVFLVLVDVFILAFCVYMRYFQKPPKPAREFDDLSKKGDNKYPDVLDEEEGAGVPPAAFLHASKEHKEKKERERQERRNKPAKVAPETKREILRMDAHPPPRKGPNVRVEKKPYLGFEKPNFLKHWQNRRNREPKVEKDSARDDMDTDRSKGFEEVQFTSIEKSQPPPSTVQQQAMKELREDTTHHLDDFLKDGGYGTANSDDSHNKIVDVDDDQLSLDDLTPPEQFQEPNRSLTPKEPKRTAEEFDKKFYGRIPLPSVTDTNVNVDKETVEKPYTDKERRHLKNTVNTYSPVLKHD
ncbi:neurogenic locus notch homolog protein 1-like isoform X1 [Mercenaria mercenaria]|uniref:neurogenic locus notch homolog protein 1-like isoform X1 n=1 Tax=Mercenaria mercenaria TaxID=6596 RepID=UPI00234FA881|nr:neurogenic locus notch homolog protein 1-like isoform X1 [Mercenaria mercenaria]XP_053397802.1 neurogenic locus notch homolog protein 1-like isoform X1 [Mercenaria mercenaria]